ncbi:DMT family transporter [Paenibacillus yanchengensis]|uniref:DMT family transporter n=1 Tax=Paenibacillus yanchengensis TaxID=2035833 RepID=A0ABW4YQK7_9BACL
MESVGKGMKVSPLEKKKEGRMKSGFWLIVIGAALWGADPLFRIILLKENMTATQITLIEHIILFIIMMPVLWKHRSELQGLKLRHIGALLFLSWGGSAIATIMFTRGLSSGDLNTVILLQKLQPLFAILMAKLLLKERLPKHFSWLLIIALAGTYLLTFGFAFPFGNISNFTQVGSLFALIAAALWGGSTVMGRLMVGQMQPVTVTSLRFILALPLLIGITINQGDPWLVATDAGTLTAVSINLLAQALLPGLLSIFIYYKGLTTTKASVATLAELSFPMVSVLINWIVFNQVISIAQAFGFVLIWVVLFIISRNSST